jgi:hypothetical protein
MSQAMVVDEPAETTEAMNAIWKRLHLVGGAAMLGIALIYVLAAVIFMPTMNGEEAPATVIEWFTLFRSEPLTGLFYLGLADIIIVILFVPVALALWSALWSVSKTWTTIAMPLAFIGAAVYLATNTALSMHSLSSDYAAATAGDQQAAILAAGQAIISISRGTGGSVGLSLVWLASLIFSILMLRSTLFGKVIAWIGIVGFLLLVPSFLFAGYTYGESAGAGAVLALVTSLGGGLLSFVWFILVGWKLLKSGN